MQNKIVCHCNNVSVYDIEKALHEGEILGDVMAAFHKVQEDTACSTGCGGCYDEILDTISDLMQA